jgi:hypothetical protein
MKGGPSRPGLADYGLKVNMPMDKILALVESVGRGSTHQPERLDDERGL